MLEKLQRVQASDHMWAALCLILGLNWIQNRRASGGISITSDGCAVSGGWFIGSADDLERNVRGFLRAAELTREERVQFQANWDLRVDDWRVRLGYRAPVSFV